MPNKRAGAATMTEQDPTERSRESTELRFHGVRYQVKDVGRSA